ncbi:carboxylesterase family protein [Croceibacterium aestuarii]|uniref:carboxylesterase family protein n=1 Tax=Croceibacterium aestuarii TaxID=3064139 RepID=UPI00272E8B29|nr:carboxylesterase family protein [Croceibacterium sp. D39]
MSLSGKPPEQVFSPWPTVDGNVIPRQLVETFARGQQTNIPVIAGFNGGEIRSLRRLLPPPPGSAQDYVDRIRAAYGELSEGFLREYPASDLDESMLAATRDAMYGWSAQTVATAQGRLGAASFLYLFDHGYPAAEAAGLKSFHGAELPFLFGTMRTTPPEWPAIPDTQEQQLLSEAMIEYWSTFAKTGRPESEAGPQWPNYMTSQQHMLFDCKSKIGGSVLDERFAIHGETVNRRRREGDTPWHWNVGFASPLRGEDR